MQVALQAVNIRPSKYTKYTKSEVEHAIRQMYGVDAVLHCR